MEQKHNRKASLIRRLPLLIVVFCAIQPLLDALGYWQQTLGLGNELTTAIRSLLLAGSVVLAFLITERKRLYLLSGIALCGFFFLHIAANLPGGYTDALSDISNLIRISSLPIMTLCFISYLRAGGEPVFRAVRIGMSIDLALILLIELLSVITGTNPYTYSKQQIGVIGWFLWGNCQSAILSMLTPLTICWMLKRERERILPVVLMTVIAELALYLFGTRLSFAALAASGLGIGACLLLRERSRWRQAVVLLLITGLFICAYPLSPTARRMNSLSESIQSKDQVVQQQLESGSTETPASDADAESKLDRLERIYRFYFSAGVDRFGIRRMAEKYHYTEDPAVLSDIRVFKRTVCELVMEDAPTLCRLFGVNVNELRVLIGREAKGTETEASTEQYFSCEVENDFHGIYYVMGTVGLAIFILLVLYFGVRVLIRLTSDFNRYFSIEMVGFLGAYLMGLVHAYFTTSVLRRNNASVYLVLVLAGLWYLSQKDLSLEGVSAASGEERSVHGAE